MIPSPLEALPPDVLGALAVERSRTVDPQARERVLARVGASVTGLAVATSVPVAGTAAAKGASHLGASFLGTKALIVVVLGAVGAGVFVQRRAASGEGAVAHPSAAPQPAQTRPEPRVVVSAPPAPAAAPARQMARQLHSKPVSPVAAPTGLAREQLLLEEARRALVNVPQSLHWLQLHEAEFPQGQLVEEREVLWVRVLVAQGARAEALGRAQLFLERFPDSAARSRIEALVPELASALEGGE